ncbi:flagellar protein FlgN [Anaerobacillus sp. MEB173]|uniref:flagellar protein FlgN n=1 Tax=Anaerobacillus sp. MEB173 TaxID=3383345 RepID=UPI003F8FBC76
MSSKQMVGVLEGMIKLHCTLYELAVEKTDVVMKGDIQALNEIVKKEAETVKQVMRLNAERNKLMYAFKKDKGWTTEDVTLQDFIAATGEEEQPKLSELQQNLVQEIEQLKQRNELNQQLLEDSLRFVNLSLDLVMPDEEAIHYRHPTKKGYDSQQGYSLFDSKI